MMAFVSASRMTRTKNLPGESEAASYAQQTIEKYRNYIACDSAWFYDANNPGACAPTPALPTTWTNDPLPDPSTVGSGSILKLGTAKRCFMVMHLPDCVPDATNPISCCDIDARVCWDDLTGCPCS